MRRALTVLPVLTVSALLSTAVVAPASAAGPSIESIWPPTGPYSTASVLDPESARYLDWGPDEWTPSFGVPWDDDLGVGTYEEDDFMGYLATLGSPYTQDPDEFDLACTANSPSDDVARVWALVDEDDDVLAYAEPSGMGFGNIVQYRDLLIHTGAEVTTSLSGVLTRVCLHEDDSEPTVASTIAIPLTIAADPDSLYRTPHQWTLRSIEGGQDAVLNAMGFAPGETVRISLAEGQYGGDDPEVSGRSEVVADGAGGIVASIPIPAGWVNSDEPTLEMFAIGAESRYGLSHFIGGDDFDPDSELELSATIVSGGGTGRLARVVLTDYAPSAQVVVALHSAAEPIVLGTMTVGSGGSVTADLPIPSGLQGSFQLWAGETTVSYHLASTPLFLGGFTDVSSNPSAANYSPFAAEIAWLASQGVTTGYDVPGGKEYRPLGNVTRDAMAAFLYRFAGSPAFTPPTTSPFTDVPTSNQFYKEITWLASTGISTGWDVGGGKKEFRPNLPIARDAMAAFLYRYAESPAFTPPTTSPFTDVPPANQFYEEITWMASTGVTTGWEVAGGKKEFRPVNRIARDAMAAFLYRFHSLG